MPRPKADPVERKLEEVLEFDEEEFSRFLFGLKLIKKMRKESGPAPAPSKPKRQRKEAQPPDPQ